MDDVPILPDIEKGGDKDVSSSSSSSSSPSSSSASSSSSSSSESEKESEEEVSNGSDGAPSKQRYVSEEEKSGRVDDFDEDFMSGTDYERENENHVGPDLEELDELADGVNAGQRESGRDARRRRRRLYRDDKSPFVLEIDDETVSCCGRWLHLFIPLHSPLTRCCLFNRTRIS